MEVWIRCNIGDVCNTISDTYRGDADEVVLVNTSDVLEGKCLNHQKSPNKNLKGQFKKTFQRDDILYSEIRPANKRFAYIDFDGTDYIASTKLMVIRHNAKILPQFLYYIITSQAIIEELQMLAESRSGTFPQITFSELSSLPIELPPLSEQAKIIALLKSLDDKIEVNRRINDNLEQQAQALFKSWFVDFEPFRDQPFVESELGMIPEGWRVIELEETCTIRYGKGLGKKDLTQDGFPVFGGNGIIGFYTHFLYELPQILVSCRGAASGKIIESLPKSYVTSNSLVLELKDRSYYNYIKLLLLNNPLYDYATGSAQPQITIDNIKGIKIILPLKEVINKVNHTLENIGSIQRNNNEESRRLAQLRDTLLPRLMSGEIKVEDVTL